VLTLFAPSGLGHVGRAARYHSVVFYTISWFLTIITSDASSTATRVSSALLFIALISPRPPSQKDDGLEPDPTGESQSSIFGLWAFAWLDNMFFKAWRRGNLESQNVPAPPLLSAADKTVLRTKRKR